MLKNKLIYLDHNATTPVDPSVLKAMIPFLKEKYGNPSSVHKKGIEANIALEEARTVIGDFLGTEAVDIIFTSGGTESNNFAIKGTCLRNRDKGNHIITSSVEHMAVYSPCKAMEELGFNVTCLPVNKYGLVDPQDVEKAITDKTILVSIMHANNEFGTIQPIAEIGSVIKKLNAVRLPAGKAGRTHNAVRIYFHTDAVQSFGKMPVDVEELGVDLLSVSAHKIYGPKGIGAIYIRKGTQIRPLVHGGHQERGFRGGTSNIPAIAGFCEAVKLAKKRLKYYQKIKALRDKLESGLMSAVKDVYINGHPDKRLPNTSNLVFRGVNNETLVVNLDLKGICASTGSACASGTVESSRVLEALGKEKKDVLGSIRFSLGMDTKDAEIEYCLKTIPPIIDRLRKALPYAVRHK